MWVMGGAGGPFGAAPGGGAAGFAGSAVDPVFCAKVELVASPAATATVEPRKVRRSSDPMGTSSNASSLRTLAKEKRNQLWLVPDPCAVGRTRFGPQALLTSLDSS